MAALAWSRYENHACVFLAAPFASERNTGPVNLYKPRHNPSLLFLFRPGDLYTEKFYSLADSIECHTVCNTLPSRIWYCFACWSTSKSLPVFALYLYALKVIAFLEPVVIRAFVARRWMKMFTLTFNIPLCWLSLHPLRTSKTRQIRETPWLRISYPYRTLYTTREIT